MEILELDYSNIKDISEMWLDLNSYHIDKVSFFSERFENVSFDNHCSFLEKQEDFKIFIVLLYDELVGFSIAFKNSGIGEIDSIYIKEKHRGNGVGEKLIEKVIEWLNLECLQIIVKIAEGNEYAFNFYRKFNFSLRYYTFQKN
ncbi:GNAT family N-acetyltransferase [Parabacteroides sp. PF5-9]|uniref:GNAT family N-acetyltransferase n=1 Tax=Parabacteroides sp. PF5-9 TaxID=1742404 RepID=UPI00247687A4|nr:GNAT family N-acetyltransferase [Parabacteroides sp. PF5-9]MDH6356351.1 ribosomal protein S18 acetylase RimI-like enzyme [Parabacteroides sp. PF5-9]